MGELKHPTFVWVRGETFKAESEAAELWKPDWNEKHSLTVLAAAIHTPDRKLVPWKGELEFRDYRAIPGCC